jgi:hypothetical protein
VVGRRAPEPQRRVVGSGTDTTDIVTGGVLVVGAGLAGTVAVVVGGVVVATVVGAAAVAVDARAVVANEADGALLVVRTEDRASSGRGTTAARSPRLPVNVTATTIATYTITAVAKTASPSFVSAIRDENTREVRDRPWLEGAGDDRASDIVAISWAVGR